MVLQIGCIYPPSRFATCPRECIGERGLSRTRGPRAGGSVLPQPPGIALRRGAVIVWREQLPVKTQNPSNFAYLTEPDRDRRLRRRDRDTHAARASRGWRTPVMRRHPWSGGTATGSCSARSSCATCAPPRVRRTRARQRVGVRHKAVARLHKNSLPAGAGKPRCCPDQSICTRSALGPRPRRNPSSRRLRRARPGPGLPGALIDGRRRPCSGLRKPGRALAGRAALRWCAAGSSG